MKAAFTVGLYVNAVVLLGVLVTLLWRSGQPAPALAQQSPMPIAGGAGFFLMPAQFSQNQWGCYIMDVDAQTLVAYVYEPGTDRLKLSAARSFLWDRQLRNFNTFPKPAEVENLVRQERDLALLPPATRPIAP